MREVLGVKTAPAGHWVGDGFPVRSLITPADSEYLSPFLLLDYGAPHPFAPATRPRGVGAHPHRGFETVTIVYQGEVTHRDSTGRGGTIGAGDVQWMTAAGGIVHQEFHSDAFTRDGGTFEVAQLWVNLPAAHKGAPAGYQSISAADIPTVTVEGGQFRIVAGELAGTRGPARAFTPMNVWDGRIDGETTLTLPDGHNLAVVVTRGEVLANAEVKAAAGQVIVFDRTGGEIALAAPDGASVLVLSGEPIDEPVVSYGPFVMNTEDEIRQAIVDFQSGRFGAM